MRSRIVARCAPSADVMTPPTASRHIRRGLGQHEPMHSASPYPEPDVPRRHRTPDEPAITRVRDSAGESRRGRHGVPGGGGGRRALIGILAEPRLVARTISLRAGDTLILSSDGLTEARTGTGRYGDE